MPRFSLRTLFRDRGQEVVMGQSVKFKLTTAAGERTVRIQNAIHSGRVRLFVDEALVWHRQDSYALGDHQFVHEFELDDVACRLVINGGHPSLFVGGHKIDRSDDGASRFR